MAKKAKPQFIRTPRLWNQFCAIWHARREAGITYGGRSLEIKGFSDSDLASDKETWRSTSGFAFMLNGSPSKLVLKVPTKCGASWSQRKEIILSNFKTGLFLCSRKERSHCCTAQLPNFIFRSKPTFLLTARQRLRKEFQSISLGFPFTVILRTPPA